MLNNYVSAPDLVVTDVAVVNNTVTVVITNEGNAPVLDPFWVDVYLNPTIPPTAVNQTWQMQGGEGPFRWQLFNEEGGELLAVSEAFALPASDGQVVAVAVSR